MVTVAKKKKIDTALGKRLRALRQAKGLTLMQLGEKAGMAYQDVARIERSEREPTWSTLTKLADALGVSLDEFRSDAEDKIEE